MMRKRVENLVFAGTAIVVVVVAILWLGAQFVRPGEVPVGRQSGSYGWMYEDQITVTGAGNEGAATGSQVTDRVVRGQIHAIYLDYEPGIAESTIVTISLSSLSLIIYQEDDVSTDDWLYPSVNLTNGQGDTTDTYAQMTINGAVNVEVGDTSPGPVVTMTMWWGP